MVVQYNTPEYDHNYGPYPYTMGNDPEEVTDEGSKIEILDRGSPVFSWPNEITQKDFTGWVEERGSKFLQSGIPSTRRCFPPTIRDRNRRRAGCSTRDTAKASTS